MRTTKPGQVVAVTGGKGGPGATTLAVGLAGALAGRGDRSVLLMDIDPAGGDVAAHLSRSGVDTRTGLLPLASLTSPAGLEPSDMAAECVQVAPRLWVLAGMPRPDTRGLVSAELLRDLLACAQKLAAVVVVDAGRLAPGAMAVQVAASAEVSLLAVRADLPGAWAASRALEALPTPARDEGLWLGLVAVAVSRGAHTDVAELEAALGYPLVGVIPADPAGIRRALASGRPPRRSRLARAYAQLAQALTATPQIPIAAVDASPPTPSNHARHLSAAPGRLAGLPAAAITKP